MTTAPALTHETLEAFHDALRGAGAPIADQLEPGLSDDQIDAVGHALGVNIPPELRTLWSWAVTPADSGVDNNNWTVNNEFDLWPPDFAVIETNRYRDAPQRAESAVAFAGPYPEGYLLVEGGAQTSLVTYAFSDDVGSLVAAPSLGALVGLWTKVLTDGSYRFDGGWKPEEGPPVIFLPSAS